MKDGRTARHMFDQSNSLYPSASVLELVQISQHCATWFTCKRYLINFRSLALTAWNSGQTNGVKILHIAPSPFSDLHFYMMQYATYSSLHILFKPVTGLLSKQSLRILIIYCHITLKGRIIVKPGRYIYSSLVKLTCWLVTCNRTTTWPLPKIEIQQTDSMSMSVTSR